MAYPLRLGVARDYSHETHLARGTEHRSHSRVIRERAHDLSYRGVIPSSLAHAVLGHSSSDLPEDNVPVEAFASMAQPDAIQAELLATKRRHRKLLPVIKVQTLLSLALRRTRYEYLSRINLWSETQPVPPVGDDPLLIVPLPRPLGVWKLVSDAKTRPTLETWQAHRRQ